MQLARVLGSTVSTIKHPVYAGCKIMVVQPLDLKLKAAGRSWLAVDTVGCGRGEVVVVCDEGRGAAQALGHDSLQPVRSIIVGIVDYVDLEDGTHLECRGAQA